MSTLHNICTNCEIKGDFEECEKTPCFVHESWYATELKNRLRVAEENLRIVEETILDCKDAVEHILYVLKQ